MTEISNSKPADRPDKNFNKKQVETGLFLTLTFDDRGLIPVATTCARTGRLLMQAWMSAEAVEKTVETGEAHYFSRSRGTLWHKGATSGEIQTVAAFRTDCDQDSLWLEVIQQGGGCCHVGYESCFYRDLPVKGTDFEPAPPSRGDSVPLRLSGKKKKSRLKKQD